MAIIKSNIMAYSKNLHVLNSETPSTSLNLLFLNNIYIKVNSINHRRSNVREIVESIYAPGSQLVGKPQSSDVNLQSIITSSVDSIRYVSCTASSN